MPDVTVRYFAGARAAAGAATETLSTTSLGELLDELARRGDRLRGVLAASTFLVDGVATADRTTSLRDGSTVDVLPPFAGG